MLDILNTLMSLALSIFAGWAVMSTCVKDGVVIKIGLVLISLGFLGTFFLGFDSGEVRSLAIVHALVSLGLLICVAGYLLRTRKRSQRVKQRRRSDWMEPTQ